MRQLTSLDAQFLMVESPTTTGHVGSLIVLDPTTSPDGIWDIEAVRACWSTGCTSRPRCGSGWSRCRSGWAGRTGSTTRTSTSSSTCARWRCRRPGSREQLGEQVARIHARPLDRTRPLWEAYVITGLYDGRAAFYSKIHHAAIDGVSGAEILETVMDLGPVPREVSRRTSRSAGPMPGARRRWSGGGCGRWR